MDQTVFAPAPMSGCNAKARILVVEDDPDSADLVVDILEDEGFLCNRAGCAAKAVELLSSSPFDVLFTDILMPGSMNGLALAEYSSEHYPGMSIVVTSGYYPGQWGDAPIRFPFLAKPYSFASLLTVLDRVRQA